ncbi:MAG: hypothetical protein OXU74_06920 [Gemmatimonadota bacterium]|nr:hypothetical protein [Gemmatimonadota bacterium]
MSKEHGVHVRDALGTSFKIVLGAGIAVAVLFLGFCTFFVGIVGIGTNLSESDDADPLGPYSEQPEVNDPTVAAPVSSWSTLTFVDEWGDRTNDVGARSEAVGPVTPMSFPYGDVTASLMASCSGAWIRFSDSPNLSGGDIRDGYEIYQIPVRIDGRDDSWRATQEWQGNDLNLPSSARSVWAAASSFEILLPWYGESRVRFRWNLTGSADAIGKTCG